MNEPGSSIPGVILAGGRARRMGGADKPLLRLAGRAVLDHIVAGLRPQVGRLAISANGDPARYGGWDLPVLADPVAGQPGPLAGVLAGLLWAAPFASHILSWPGDTPHPPHDVTARLMAAASYGRVACASSGGRLHPVVAVWPVELADSLRSALDRGQYRVAAFAEAAGLTVVAWPDNGDPFLNLNTPAELDAAERAGGPM